MMLHISLVVLVCISSSLVLSKSEEPVCFKPADANGAFPCESRPSKEPLSLQYSKAQSSFIFIDSIVHSFVLIYYS